MSENGKIEVPENDLQKIMKVVNTLSEGNIQIIRLEANQANIDQKLEQEIKDRKEDTGEVKNNYIARFEKIDNTLNIIFNRMNAFYFWLFTSLFGTIIFAIIAKIMKWI